MNYYYKRGFRVRVKLSSFFLWGRVRETLSVSFGVRVRETPSVSFGVG